MKRSYSLFVTKLIALPSCRLPEFEQNDLGFCQHYRGVACSQLIGNRTVYVKTKMTLNQMEEKLAAIFTILATGKVREISMQINHFVVVLPEDTGVRRTKFGEGQIFEVVFCQGQVSKYREHKPKIR